MNHCKNLLGRICDPQLASTFGKIFLETDNQPLRGAMAEALANMGISGFKYLVAGAKQENCYKAAN